MIMTGLKMTMDDKVKQQLLNNTYKGDIELSLYKPTEEELQMRNLVVRHFTLGDTTMQCPRVEFNDLSVLYRQQYDQMLFNTYQPNNGNGYVGDAVNGWRSQAMRPIVRNKCVSIAAHATARLIFPKIWAENEQSEYQENAAKVMEYLMEWANNQSNYKFNALKSTITALYEPASIAFVEYAEAFREVKEKKVNGKWTYKKMKDETMYGHQYAIVPINELYIENFYEPDIQKQGWLIWRRVQSYSLMEAKYKAKYKNFQYVTPGVQIIYNDANQSFYQVYDNIMRPYDCEEIIYWNKSLDVKLILVNGVMLTEYDNPNPRNDKLYPFVKSGYEFINNKCFYYKSLAFKMMQDANIVNTLYPMIIDGTYLNLMPPMVAIGSEIIGSQVIVPGLTTTLTEPNSDLRAIQTSNDLRAGMDTLFKVEESINQSSEEPLLQGKRPEGDPTAYEISRLEQNANTVLGLFVQMIVDHVKQYGTLLLGDILQYHTIVDAEKITDQPELVYKTFLVQDTGSKGKVRHKKIMFDSELSSEPMSSDEYMDKSYSLLEEQGGPDGDIELYKANPELFRNLKFMVSITPDVMNPMSEDLERAYKLDAYDRAIQNPLADQEEVFKDLLLGANPVTKRNPDKYINKNAAMGLPMNPMEQVMQSGQAPTNQANQPPLPALARR